MQGGYRKKFPVAFSSSSVVPAEQHTAAGRETGLTAKVRADQDPVEGASSQQAPDGLDQEGYVARLDEVDLRARGERLVAFRI